MKRLLALTVVLLLSVPPLRAVEPPKAAAETNKKEKSTRRYKMGDIKDKGEFGEKRLWGPLETIASLFAVFYIGTQGESLSLEARDGSTHIGIGSTGR